MRINIKELNTQRISAGLLRRINDIPSAVSWRRWNRFANRNRKKLETFRNKHLGQRCFIMANGPSLTKLNLDLLKNEITFGLNRIYLLFDELPFIPDYYVTINELVIEQFCRDINRIDSVKILNWNRRHCFGSEKDSNLYIKTRYSLKDKFSGNIIKPITTGGTVTYVTLQIAFFMGFKEVILIGLDHNYRDIGTPNLTQVRENEKDLNHFHPNYFPKGYKWQLPDLYRSELAYSIAREAYERDNRKIIDATLGGKCTIFEKMDYYKLF